jgi:hypothetical protein
MRRLAGTPPPWTSDPVLAAYRFTNVYRAADRVSQYLIRRVIYDGQQTADEIFFRTLLFKFFNRIETWDELSAKADFPRWTSFDFERYASILDAVFKRGAPIYSAAYIMPSPALGSRRKHRNHLRLLAQMIADGVPSRLGRARSLRAVFDALRVYPSIGDFLAFQYTIDLNYSQLLDFTEMEFVMAGPGARSGILRCFLDTAGFSDADVIRAVTERAEDEFSRLGLRFEKLWGRPLQLIDCQNLFCEVDKYARVAHPELASPSGRTRIKQKFVPKQAPLIQWYPPKWGLSIPQSVGLGLAT